MKVSKSAVFVFELMIIILVFALAAAVCTRTFAASYSISKESHELTMSSINAQTVAERFKAGSPDSGTLYFDKNWRAADAKDAWYTVALEEQDGRPWMREAFVSVYEKGREAAIYSLHVKRFEG